VAVDGIETAAATAPAARLPLPPAPATALQPRRARWRRDPGHQPTLLLSHDGVAAATSYLLLAEAWLPCARKRRRKARERAGPTRAGDGMSDGLGKETEWRLAGCEPDSDERSMERLLDPVFTLVLLFLTIQLLLHSLLELL